jgi:putative ABC transport system substrate-binding protein
MSGMRRRGFITLLGGAAAWPVAARAQQRERMRRLGVMFATSQRDPDTPARLAIMRQELHRLGWEEGKTLQIDLLYGDGDTRLIAHRASELVGSTPDVILILDTVVASAVHKLTRSIPVVFVQVSDPVQAGFVTSLAQPAGNFTRFTTYEYSMAGKWLEVLKEAVPPLTRVLLLLNPENTAQWAGYSDALAAFAPRVGAKLILGPVRDHAEIERAIVSFAGEPNRGLVVPPDAILGTNRQLIVSLAQRYRLPAIFPYRSGPASGGLLSYGIDVVDQFRRATGYVDRLLKGEKPSELPVQAPTDFKLVVNLKTAKALGLEVPPMLLARADEVIE